MNTKNLKPLLSVIIPTFNRADLLKQSIESLTAQSLSNEQFELIVVDDGSTDHTQVVCREFRDKINLKYQRQRNSGIAAAKNLGIFLATGELLFFFDDDDVADKNLLCEHVKTHSRHREENIAVLGHTTWHASLTVNRVMDYVTNIGHFLFSYSNLKHDQWLDYTYFWGGRSSCKKSMLVKNGIFNQLFRFGSEDIELGYRLSKSAFKVIYNANAKSFMIRPVTYDHFCQRCVNQGKSQYHFSKLHSDPVIQNYCMTDRVDEKWVYVSKSLDSRIQRVKDLESLSDSKKRLSKEQVQELGNLYWWTFNALKIKGIIEAKELDKSLSIPHENHFENLSYPTISLGDTDNLCKNWGGHTVELNTRGNVLIIDPFLPMFDRASGSLRLFEIIQALIRMNFCVTFISRHAEYTNQYVPILQNMGVEVYVFDPMALQAVGLYVIGPYLDIEKILRSKHYAHVILSFWHVAEYYLPIIRKHSPDSNIIIDTVDIHFQREFREAKLKNDKTLLAYSKKNKAREIAIYEKADRIWVVTDDDKKTIDTLVKLPIDVIPNIHKKIVREKEYNRTSDLLFVGNFNHKPNIDAVRFFHKEIYPLIRKLLPDAKIYIVGNNPPEEILRIRSDHFIVTGYVEDLSKFLMNIRISINPLTYGAGMKGKIGEALSWGIPIVTTTIGAEGMGLQDHENAMIADDPKDFARKVYELYHDQIKWEKLSRNGKKLVNKRWSPNAVQKRIEASILARIRFKENQCSIVSLSSDINTTLEECSYVLDSLTDLPFEVIVINRNFDYPAILKLTDAIERTHLQQKIQIVREKYGTPKILSWNKALTKCTGDRIILCRHFDAITVTALKSAILHAQQHPEMDIVIPSVPTLLAEKHSLNNTNCAKTSNNELKPRIKKLDFMILRSTILKDIGGFDATFRDDHLAWFDFLVRSQLSGFKIASVENAELSNKDTISVCVSGNYVDIEDLDTFLTKWDLPSETQGPITFFNVTQNESIDSWDLFSSFSNLDEQPSTLSHPSNNQTTKHIQPALTSIIILCFNQLEYTKKCLQSIKNFTTVPYELILVDNGSSDGTKEFLEDYAKKHSDCNVIYNASNFGYAGGNNQGISIAKGEYILLLNNDVVVTKNWLERLIKHAESDKNVGMVGPVSNSVSGPQQVDTITYDQNLTKMHRFANNLGKQNIDQIQDVLRLVGFCLLIKRQVLDIIGLLDESYGNGNYEDDDLCLRSRIAGFRNLIARDVFIHHYGSMTFKGNSIDYSSSLLENKTRFFEKWEGIVESIDDATYRVNITVESQLQKLLEWGENQFNEGNLHAAIKIFGRILTLDPTNSQAINNIGVIQWQLGDPTAAIKMFKNALLNNPKDENAIENLIQAVLETGKIDLIEPDLFEVLKQSQPENKALESLRNSQNI